MRRVCVCVCVCVALPGESFFPVEFGCTLAECVPPADASLNSDLYRLHGRESYVSKELCTGAGSQVEHCTI